MTRSIIVTNKAPIFYSYMCVFFLLYLFLSVRKAIYEFKLLVDLKHGPNHSFTMKQIL